MIKRIIAFFLALVMIVTGVEIMGMKEVRAEDNLIASGTDWELRDNGTLVLTTSYMNDYTINYHAPWHEYRDQIINVEAESLRSVGDYAFYECSELENIDLSRATEIGQHAFERCSSLKKIYFNPQVIIEKDAFNNCISLIEISIPADVTIGEYAFANCDSLRSVYITTGEDFWTSSFEVEDNSFPDNDISIYYVKGQKFADSLKTNEVGSKFQWIESLYGRCGHDATWSYNEENKTLKITGTGRVAGFSSGSDTPWYLFKDIKHIVVENGITEITSYFFEYLYTVETVSFKNTLKVLACNAFNDCSSLNNILLPDSIESFGSTSYKFNRCESLTDVYYEGTEEEWEEIKYYNGVEADATDSTPFTLHFLNYYEEQPAGCEKDGYEAYYSFDDTSVYSHVYNEERRKMDESVSIPATGHNYGAPEFIWAEDYSSCTAKFECLNCRQTLDVACTVSNEMAEESETGVLNIVYTAEVFFLDKTYTDIKYIIINEDENIIAEGTGGEEVNWTLTDDGVLTFSGEGAMANYPSKTAMPWYDYVNQITSIIIEEGVTTIGELAFYGMPGLESVKIPDSVTHIGSFAFKNAVALKDISLSSALTQLGESAFYGCTSLTSIDIPASLWTVKPYTFKNCTSLETVTFHEGNLMKISDGAFYNTAVKEVILPDCLDILDVYVFKNCANLANVTFGKEITEVREAALYGTAISELTIPDNITKIKSYAFKNCKNLASIDFGSGLTFIGEAGFYECTVLTNLSIPRGVTDIQGYAFKKCTGLEMISLPSTLTTLGESAFHSCTGLESILIPKNVNGIGGYCFSGSGLKEITFQGSAPKIGDGAFKGLTVKAYYPEEEKSWTDEVMVDYGGSIVWEAE